MRVRVMLFIASGKGSDKTHVRDTFHERENPLREERSAGLPVNAPTCRMNLRFPPSDLALSSWSRTSRPIGTPVSAEVSFSQAKSSSVRRIVSV